MINVARMGKTMVVKEVEMRKAVKTAEAAAPKVAVVVPRILAQVKIAVVKVAAVQVRVVDCCRLVRDGREILILREVFTADYRLKLRIWVIMRSISPR